MSYFHLHFHETLCSDSLVWICTDRSWKCLHSDICINAKWLRRMIMNTKWINNDMWIMNTIYSSSDKIVSFLACTCINSIRHYSSSSFSTLPAHHRHLLSLDSIASFLKAVFQNQLSSPPLSAALLPWYVCLYLFYKFFVLQESVLLRIQLQIT